MLFRSVSALRGSEANDAYRFEDGRVVTETNHCGGVLGGMSNGDTIIFRIAVKPVPSVFVEQETVKMSKGKLARTKLKIQGRHDVCLCPRVVPVVEAMAALVIADALLQDRAARL